jgi:demethylmenaquinone methyltransferase/2-methoxy-6-polyprenyl-1,4-benzoquinol methylase
MEASEQTEAHHARPERDSEQFASDVRGMFDRIAGVYDLMNSAMTAGLHHQWRERAVDLAEVGPGSNALDLCCGTGDLALALRRRIGPDGRVVGSDFSEPMLELARERRASTPSRSGSAPATSPTCRRACRRWPGS